MNEMDSGELQFFKEKISGVEKRLNELRNISDRANFRVVVRFMGLMKKYWLVRHSQERAEMFIEQWPQ